MITVTPEIEAILAAAAAAPTTDGYAPDVDPQDPTITALVKVGYLEQDLSLDPYGEVLKLTPLGRERLRHEPHQN